MKIGNSYYDIACNDFLYLCDAVSPIYFNPVIAQVQQVAEKMLKSVADLVCVDIEKLMASHNLRALYDAVHAVDADFLLDRRGLSLLKDYYYDARYPGDNFVTVTREELLEALYIMADTVREVERWRKSHDLPCQIKDPDKFLEKAYKILGVSQSEGKTAAEPAGIRRMQV